MFRSTIVKPKQDFDNFLHVWVFSSRFVYFKYVEFYEF